MNTPPDWEDPRRVLARHRLRPKASFSQNFLVEPRVVEDIVAALELSPGEPVVELGPGLGTLTGGILRGGGRVIAVEQDRDMLAVLAEEFRGLPTLELSPGDAAEVDLRALHEREGAPLKLAGNLPYAITGSIMRRLVEERAHLDRAIVMVQKEVRDRMASEPGKKSYGALTVFVQAAFEVSTVCVVPAGAFHPPPKVDSAVICLKPRVVPLAEETPAFQAVVRAAFAQRRKTLRNALMAAGRSAAEVDAALSEAGITPGVRGETLDVLAFKRLADALPEKAV